MEKPKNEDIKFPVNKVIERKKVINTDFLNPKKIIKDITKPINAFLDPVKYDI